MSIRLCASDTGELSYSLSWLRAARIESKRAVPTRKCGADPTSYRFAAAMPQQLRPMILFSEALTRFRNRGCESLHFERLNEHIEQLIQNQSFDQRREIHQTQSTN